MSDGASYNNGVWQYTFKGVTLKVTPKDKLVSLTYGGSTISTTMSGSAQDVALPLPGTDTKIKLSTSGNGSISIDAKWFTGTMSFAGVGGQISITKFELEKTLWEGEVFKGSSTWGLKSNLKASASLSPQYAENGSFNGFSGEITASGSVSSNRLGSKKLEKTWEGELALVSLPGSTVEKFNFTVHDEAVAQKINAVMGKRVSLHYEEKVGLPTSCFGETRYFVTGLTETPDIPLGPGVSLPTHPSAPAAPASAAPAASQ